MLHPFQSSPAPTYKDARLRGLVLDLKLSPQPVKLSEVRQLEVKITLTNVSKRAVALEFPTEQRIEIYLRNSSEAVLTTWSDNHAFEAKVGYGPDQSRRAHLLSGNDRHARADAEQGFHLRRFSFRNIPSCASGKNF